MSLVPIEIYQIITTCSLVLGVLAAFPNTKAVEYWYDLARHGKTAGTIDRCLVSSRLRYRIIPYTTNKLRIP
jgi:hypothetical protein